MASSKKTAANRLDYPILAGKSICWAFQRVSRIALKVPELREKWVFLSSAADFFEKIPQDRRPEKSVFCYFFFTQGNIYDNGVCL